MMNAKNETKYWLARNILTGYYYSMSMGCGFVSKTTDHATHLDSRQVAITRATYLNAEFIPVK